ncbi:MULTISPECIES: zinc ribbon domain-containing protein [Metallosphaera]|uniref:Transposase, IS605 OrfB n=3 Tax=Metallosphaera TaxID=41980 RepID=A4YD63_METS5|nr:MULTISPECIES: zinc ribbon domain-containing protein [Metallosphaera]ABP94365.1 transposase, IS605 OrfB [Metallosphaera sedula DSM 5348]AIM26352.1 transposase, IS605 OrfB [Metallosphaera sedula]AKV73361.1 transposase [Metallosphaera sedula]AKV75605.1 transposase [Metallosphaera sedula]AKV77851.1 transposase [Metallosphaera sedula]
MKEHLVEAKIIDYGKLKTIHSDIVYYVSYYKTLEKSGVKTKPSPPPSLKDMNVIYTKPRIGPLKLIGEGPVYKLDKVGAIVSVDFPGTPLYAIVDFEDSIRVYLAYPVEDPIVGIDLGIRHLFTVVAVTKNGKIYKSKYIGNGSIMETFTKYMSETQGLSYVREIREKVRISLRELMDFLVELSPKIVALEDLRLYDAKIGRGLKLIEDELERELLEKGIRFRRLDPRNTSKVCSQCGYKKGEVMGSLFVCPACGYKVDRDFNAAYNLALKCYYTC